MILRIVNRKASPGVKYRRTNRKQDYASLIPNRRKAHHSARIDLSWIQTASHIKVSSL